MLLPFLLYLLGPFLLVADRMVSHAIELLTAGNDQAEILLHEERNELGGISIAELHRLIYAQVLSAHPLTWQVSANKLNLIHFIDFVSLYSCIIC